MSNHAIWKSSKACFLNIITCAKLESIKTATQCEYPRIDIGHKGVNVVTFELRNISRITLGFVGLISFVLIFSVPNAHAQQQDTSFLNFYLGTNTYRSSAIKENFNPANGNDQNASIGANSLSVGLTANARSDNSLAVGDQALVGTAASGGTAIGASATVNVANGTAIGAFSRATNANDVALGANSVTSATTATAGTTIKGTNYSFAGATPTGALAVGGRQIQNVAAGQINANSTDAINGSQLYATNQALESQIVSGSNDALKSANTYSDNLASYAISSANNYTDQKFAYAIGYTDQKFNAARRSAHQAAAIGMSAATLRYDDRPGKLSAAVGSGVWNNQAAFSMGLGYTSQNQRIRSNISTTTTGNRWGVGGGLSFTLN